MPREFAVRRRLLATVQVLAAVALVPGAGHAFGASAHASAGSGPAPRFSAPVFAATGESPTGPVAADFNGDGKPDLATADESSDSVSVLLGRGDGSFQKRHAVRVARAPLDVVNADVDRDGDADLITASSNRAGSVTVLLNDGAGRFHRDHTYAADAFGLAA